MGAGQHPHLPPQTLRQGQGPLVVKARQQQGELAIAEPTGEVLLAAEAVEQLAQVHQQIIPLELDVTA